MANTKESLVEKVEGWLTQSAKVKPWNSQESVPSTAGGKAEELPPPRMLRRPEQPVMADGHHPVEADLYLVDPGLGSFGVIHCISEDLAGAQDGEARNNQIRGWVEDAAYLRHLMVMRNEAEALRPNRSRLLPWSVELVFVVHKDARTTLDALRDELHNIKANTELLHGIGINLAVVGLASDADFGRQLKRGFSWLLVDVRKWLESSLNGQGNGGSRAGVQGTNGTSQNKVGALTTTDFRVPGKRLWKPQRTHAADGKGPLMLHVMHGPNGSGKSTLAEAFEYVVTGRSTRLKGEAPNLDPLVFGGRPKESDTATATVTLALDPQSPRDATITLLGTGGSSAKSELSPPEPVPNLRGPAIRFDEAVGDQLLGSDAKERMAFWLEGYFPQERLTLDREKKARKDLEEALNALGLEWGPEQEEKVGILKDKIGADDAGADIRWKELAKEIGLDLDAGWMSVVGALGAELGVRLQGRGNEAEAALRELLQRGSDVLSRATPLLDERFGKDLERLGDVVFAGAADPGGDERDPDEVHATWLENVARADLLESALNLRQTFDAWTPSSNDILGRNQFTVDSGELEDARRKAIQARDDARLWLSKHLESTRQGAVAGRGGGRTASHDVALMEQVVASLEQATASGGTGPFGDMLPLEEWRAILEAWRRGEALELKGANAGKEPGWTRPLVDRWRTWRQMEEWRSQWVAKARATDWVDIFMTRLSDLVRALRERGRVKAEDATRFKAITGKLPEALQELVELMTPASWAYAPMEVKVGFGESVGEASGMEFKARGMELEEVLNTAEKNAVALAMHLLCAPKALNPFRITFLDDPFQNMDELTVTITARALARLLRLMGSMDAYQGWELVLLLHGADDCERVVQEVPSALYRIPWSSPAVGSVPDQRIEPLGDADSAGGELFDFEKFIGLTANAAKGAKASGSAAVLQPRGRS